MKNYSIVIVAITSLLALNNSFAAYPGAGIGLQFGQAFTQFEASDLNNNYHTADTRNSGLAGRVYLDFQIDPICP